MAADRQSVAGNGESPSPISGSAGHALLAVGGLLRRAEVSPDGRALYQIGGREADTFYRDRWSYDKVVRSTHGVNCTGSSSWKVYPAPAPVAG